MKLNERLRAASAAFRGKSAKTEQVNLDQLRDFLGLTDVPSTVLSEATYYACLKVLSEALGKLPLKILQYTEDGGVRVAREHPYYRMLNERPNRYMPASIFWSATEMLRDHEGNGYAWIDTRDPMKPQLWPLDPNSVQVWYNNTQRLADVPDVFYRYTTPSGTMILGSEEVLHVKAHYTVDGLVGVPVRKTLADTIQGNVKAQNMANRLYDSDMTAKAVLNYTGSLNDASVATLVKEVGAYLKRQSGEQPVIPLPVGFTLQPLNMRLTDSQFIQIKQYSALQIASAFGVKPYQVGDYTKSSYASAEAQQLSFLVDTLLYIVKQYEEELSYKLLTDKERIEGYHIKFNTAVLLRVDQQTQIATLAQAVQSFLYTPNEAREFLDKPAVDGGDQLLGNGASIPVQFAGLQYTQAAQATEETETEPTSPETEPTQPEPPVEETGGEEETEE